MAIEHRDRIDRLGLIMYGISNGGRFEETEIEDTKTT